VEAKIAVAVDKDAPGGNSGTTPVKKKQKKKHYVQKEHERRRRRRRDCNLPRNNGSTIAPTIGPYARNHRSALGYKKNNWQKERSLKYMAKCSQSYILVL
jgi:hypothetical protein